MPDFGPFLHSVVVAASITALAAAAIFIFQRRRKQDGAGTASTATHAAVLVAIVVGVAFGCSALSLRPNWPPVNGLDRWLTIILPGALIVEGLAGWNRVSRRIVWLLRLALVAACGRILLHGSVYLGGPHRLWTSGQAAAVLIAAAVTLAIVWGLLAQLFRRSPGITIILAPAVSIAGAGVAVMLAGYLKGGSIALPLSAALVGVALALSRKDRAGREFQTLGDSTLALSVVGLFGVLFIGLFFGRLTVAGALAMFCAPTLCWVTELPILRRRSPWIVGAVRLGLIAVPFLIVLAIAKQDFDRHTAPLLGRSSSTSRGP